MPTNKLKNLKWLHRLVRAALLADVVILVALCSNPINAFFSSGTRGVRGYFEHVALQGVDLTATRPSEVAELVERSQHRFLLVGGALMTFFVGLLTGERLLARKRAVATGDVCRSEGADGLPR